MLNNKIDFVVYFTVENANPNGDPLSGNMPRQDNELKGIVSDVCIKRKLRNRMQDMGNHIFVQSDERSDGFKSLKDRFNSKFKAKDADDKIIEEMCKDYLDVRSFGQVIAFNKGQSIGIRGPVSITMAKSLEPVNVVSMQITKSTVAIDPSDTMGMKHYVDFGLYCFSGSINPFFAEKTGFSKEDGDILKEALKRLFVNDASSARPDGSMQILKVYWMEHPSKLGIMSSARLRSLFSARLKNEELSGDRIEDYEFAVNTLDAKEIQKLIDGGATVEIFEEQ